MSSLLITYLINSKLIITEFLNYTNTFLTKLFPSTFIIYLFTNIFIEYNLQNKLKPQKYKNELFIILMSIIGGFPSGPKLIIELLKRKEITEETANCLIYFVHFPNPLFLLGTISKLISKKELIYIIISIYLSNLLISLTLINKKNYSQTKQTTIKKNFSTILEESIYKSLKISILIFGTSIFFYLISVIITNYLHLNTKYYILTTSLFDLTKAITLTSLIKNTLQKSIYIITMLSMTTISIHVQIKSILSDTNIKYKNFIYGRIISTIISIILYITIRNL